MVISRRADQDFNRSSILSHSSHGSNLHFKASPVSKFASCCTKWRIVQWALFVAILIGVAVTTYSLISQSEQDDFEQAFQQTAAYTIQEMEEAYRNTGSLLQTFSLSVSASTPPDAWPYVTIPNYHVLVDNYIQQSHASMVAFSPLTNSPTGWERYVAQGQAHQEATVFTTYVFKIEQGMRVQDFGLVEGYMAPVWQIKSNSTADSSAAINYNLFQSPWIYDLMQASMQDKQAKLSPIVSPNQATDLGPLPTQGVDAWSLLVQPILRADSQQEVVGFLMSHIPWGATLFAHRLGQEVASDEGAILCVLREQGTSNSFTYRVEGSQANYLGSGDSWIETEAYGNGSSSSSSNPETLRRQLEDAMTPPFVVDVYPTKEYHDSYTSNEPAIFTGLVVLLMVLLALLFVVFQHYHDRETFERELVNEELNGFGRQASSRSLMPTAKGRKKNEAMGLPENNKQLLNAFLADQKRSHDLVGLDGSNLDDSMDRVTHTNNTNSDFAVDQLGASHTSFNSAIPANPAAHNSPTDNLLPAWADTKAIADLFPSATVLFADISGFTAWSSVREPSQAFSLLENIYYAFDKLGAKRRVFKVESIGDCYTAVCGLPERRTDHAVALCYFARGCLRRFRLLTRTLEEKLGPETSELALRVGVNSGPIVAGILRGESTARFQLFGETVTMASKMEGSGQPGRIHVSKETATQLIERGKGHWLLKREEKIVTSKGELQTFWLLDDVEARLRHDNNNPKVLKSRDSEVSDASLGDDTSGWGGQDRQEQAPSSKHDNAEEANSKLMRLVGWNVEIMVPLLKMIVARRAAESKRRKSVVTTAPEITALEGEIGCHKNVLDEVEEVISLPHYDAKVQQKIKSDPHKVQLGEYVEAELKEYVYVIANLYQGNPFHNFEHASHVTMSTQKLLSRIVAPEEVMEGTTGKKTKDVASQLHDSTYGITSDPLTQFAVILAALIHDVDHRGVPNFILCKEEKELAAVYDNKSVAEQNSVDIAWETLMDRRFSRLRRTIYSSEAELKRFRVLLVNCVMSTDIFDKQLSALRKSRWEKAFSIPDDLANAEDINRKATIVIEHLIQASDVSHTMQHWHIYKKWNERLFHEMYSAYRLGRADKDPTEGWYKGEIWFFDNYVIPLAKKLESCGVFGVSSDEYLTYAVNNRNEWEEKGEKVVKDMVDKYSAMMDVEAMAPTKPTK